jgi:uncharacterized small protein (DUF1192 family)
MAFDLEDLDPRGGRKAKPLNLDDLNIEDLEEYVAVLDVEIARVKAKIEAKRSHASAASSFFKKQETNGE